MNDYGNGYGPDQGHRPRDRRPGDVGEWRPVPFGHLLFGQLVTDGFTVALPSAVVVLLINYFALDAVLSVNTVIAVVLVLFLISQVLVALATRRISIAQRHISPGSPLLAALQMAVPPLIASLAGGAMAVPGAWSMPWALVFGGTVLVFSVLNCSLITQSWRQGMTSQEISEKVQKTKEMTREHFASDDQ